MAKKLSSEKQKTVKILLTFLKSFFETYCYKVGILQYFLLPRARWPIQIDEVPFSTILKLEQFKWLKIHHSTTNICLYSSTSPCPLPIKSLTSILKAAKVPNYIKSADSLEKFKIKIKQWTPNNCTCRLWKPYIHRIGYRVILTSVQSILDANKDISSSNADTRLVNTSLKVCLLAHRQVLGRL